MSKRLPIVSTLVLAIIVAMTTFTSSAPRAEAATNTVAFTLPTLTAQVGNYVTVPIVVSGGSPIIIVDILIRYDKTRLQLSGLPSGESCNLGQGTTSWNTSESIVWSYWQMGTAVIPNCTKNMSFKVVGEGTAPLNL